MCPPGDDCPHLLLKWEIQTRAIKSWLSQVGSSERFGGGVDTSPLECLYIALRISPQMDVEHFLADNPYFSSNDSGCLGVVLVMAVAAFAVVALIAQWRIVE